MGMEAPNVLSHKILKYHRGYVCFNETSIPPLERKLLNFVIIPLPDGDFNGVVANSRFQNRCLLMYPNALYNQKFKDDKSEKKKANNKTPRDKYKTSTVLLVIMPSCA